MKKKIMLCEGCRIEYERAGIPAKASKTAMVTQTTCAACRKRRPCKLTEVGK